jgi:hypothetical protein
MNSLSLAPCDRGGDMFWSNRLIKGDSFQMYNKATKSCMTLRHSEKNTSEVKVAELKECADIAEQQIDFIK